MARRFSAGAFIVLLSVLLLAPFETQARSGGVGAGRAGGGGFARMPAVRFRAAPRPSIGRGAVRRFDAGRPGFGRHGVHPRAARHFVRKHYRGGYGYGAFSSDAIAVIPPSAYPAATMVPVERAPDETVGGMGGPLVLRHVCQSEVQVVPSTRGGEHEVTVTRCRLFAE